MDFQGTPLLSTILYFRKRRRKMCKVTQKNHHKVKCYNEGFFSGQPPRALFRIVGLTCLWQVSSHINSLPSKYQHVSHRSSPKLCIFLKIYAPVSQGIPWEIHVKGIYSPWGHCTSINGFPPIKVGWLCQSKSLRPIAQGSWNFCVGFVQGLQRGTFGAENLIFLSTFL